MPEEEGSKLATITIRYIIYEEIYYYIQADLMQTGAGQNLFNM